jgi:catechol 2,3-dioxygenase-like lactoylglutathione lyase family enzyme
MKLKCHATVLLVDDVRRAADYYRDRLGFEVAVYEEEPELYGFATRDGCYFHFAHYEGATPRPNNAVVSPDMFDVYVYPDDVDALHAELVERGAEIVSAPAAEEYGMYDFRVRDQDGYILAFGKRL